MYRARRRRLLLGVVLVLLLAYTAGQLLNDTGHARMPTPQTGNDHPRTSMAAVSWPQRQAAPVLGNGRRRQARESSRSRSPAWRL